MPTDDPQKDEDEHVKERVAEVSQRWERWALSQRFRTNALLRRGSDFEASLTEARSSARRAAAALLRTTSDPALAAGIMHRTARAHIQRTLPIVGCDHVCVEYTVARTWQDCARELDPDLPEVKPKWT